MSCAILTRLSVRRPWHDLCLHTALIGRPMLACPGSCMVAQQQTQGEHASVRTEQAHDTEKPSVEGIRTRTGKINPDSADGTEPHPGLDAHGGSEQGGMAGPIGYFEGEGNEG